MRFRPLLFTLSTLFVASPALAAVTEVTGFGANPAGLKTYEHVPSALAAKPAAVLVLHGCTSGGAADVEGGQPLRVHDDVLGGVDVHEARQGPHRRAVGRPRASGESELRRAVAALLDLAGERRLDRRACQPHADDSPVDQRAGHRRHAE